MPRILALDWGPQRLRLALANCQGNKITLEDLRCVDLTSDRDSQDSDQGSSSRDRISKILSENRYRGVETLVTVRRSDVELRLLTLPPVPAAELPEIVKLQALREFSEVSDDWPIDYLPLVQQSDQTVVLAAALSPRRRKEYDGVLSKADLRAEKFILRPTATSLLVNRRSEIDRPDVEICVDDLDHEIEMSVLRHGAPILIRTTPTPKSESYDRAAFLAGEIRRTMVAASNQLRNDAVQQIVMFGTDGAQTSQIAESLQSLLSLPVRVLDPFQDAQFGKHVDPEQVQLPQQFAATMGLLLSGLEERPEVIDFANPRRVEPPKSSRNLVIGAAVAAGVCALLGLGLFYWTLSSLDAEARDLQMTMQKQKKLVEAAEQRIADVTSVETWEKSRVNWLKEFAEMSTEIPDARQVRFSRVQADILASGEGQVILEGVASDQATIGVIDQALRSGQRRVRGSGGDFDDRDPDYPWTFKHTVTLMPPEDATASNTSASSPPTNAASTTR